MQEHQKLIYPRRSPKYNFVVSMAAAEAALQAVSGAVPRQIYTNLRSTSLLSFKYHIKSRKDENYGCISRKGQGISKIYVGSHVIRNTHRIFGEEQNIRSKSLRCSCIGAESVREAFREDGNKRLVNGVARDLENQSLEAAHHLKYEKEGLLYNNEFSSDTTSKIFSGVGANSLEDEAWNLLRASMVYYCGNPVGTIAANDPSDSNTLNYDQVFIRDFVPSGIAFLLKGEYEIVRNFILHTLQLQVM